MTPHETPALLATATRLEAAGIDRDLAIAAAGILHREMQRIVEDTVLLFTIEILLAELRGETCTTR